MATDVQDRGKNRQTIYEWKPKPEEERERGQKPVWSEGRREALRTMMKNWWKTKKALKYVFHAILTG